MKDKVCLSVLLPATQATYEFRVPFDATVDEATQLMASILAAREPARFETHGDADLMLCGSVQEGGGQELNPNETFRALVSQGVLTDGSPVALV